MNLNYKEKSIILAALSNFQRDKFWKSDINLIDLREGLTDRDLIKLTEKVAGACHRDLDELKDPTIPAKHHENDTRGLSPFNL
jgi:hypothetical protein